MKNLGIILLAIGSLLLILCMLVPAMGDLADQNAYTIGSVCLIFVGAVAHVILKKIDLAKR